MNADCQRALLNLDLEIDAAEAEWQDGHLLGCEACRTEADRRDRVRAGLQRAVKSTPVDVTFEQRLRGSLARPSFLRQWRAFAAAAVVLISAGLYWIGPVIESRVRESAYFQVLPETVSRIMRVGLSDHVHCAAFRKFRKPPVAEELPAAFRPVLAHIPAGYSVAAAHECKTQGRPFVHFVLRGAGEKTVSLVMARKQRGETFANSALRRVAGSAVFTEDVPRFQIAGFEAESYLVFVVSDMTGEQNQQLAFTLAGPVTALLNRLV